MQINFQTNKMRSLTCCVNRVMTQEQTQEVRLPESMPDIARVLGVWGKPVIRGKEWQNGSMSVAGGVMTWVMYAQEEDGNPQILETWIPFQMKWELPETRYDGYIFAVPALKSIDARSTNPRKLMVRANLSVWGRGIVPEETEVYTIGSVPDDVQVLDWEYPMDLALESGEIQLHVEEAVDMAGFHPVPETILRHDFQPTVTEQRIMASRLVMRGKGNLHLVYLADGKVYNRDVEVDFSQFTDLDGEFSQAATAQIIPVITNAECDGQDGVIHIRCDMVAQYMIFDRVMVPLTEDAYSNERAISLENSQLRMDRMLERKIQPVHLEHKINVETEKIADISCLLDFPYRTNTDGSSLVIPGQIALLYYDRNGNLQAITNRFEHRLPWDMEESVTLGALVSLTEPPRGVSGGSQVDCSWNMAVETTAFVKDGQWMVTGMELGEVNRKEEPVPSLILQRYADQRLWDTAKACGSTVDAILRANGLEEAPEVGKMILIPVS